MTANLRVRAPGSATETDFRARRLERAVTAARGPQEISGRSERSELGQHWRHVVHLVVSHACSATMTSVPAAHFHSIDYPFLQSRPPKDSRGQTAYELTTCSERSSKWLVFRVANVASTMLAMMVSRRLPGRPFRCRSASSPAPESQRD
jgi:hypothetical protein